MANKLIIAKGKGTIPNSGYQFDGDFREGTTPTLLDSRQAQRVKAFIENLVFRSMFEIQTGSPSQNSFQMDFSNNQSVWFRLAVQTALQFDKNPTLGGNLHLDNKYLISDQPGFKFVQYAASGFSVHPQSWPSDTLDAFGASSLLYGWYNGTPYHVGFRCPSSASLASSGSLDTRGGIVWVLPAADGSTGQVLSTNGSRHLSWITASGSGTVTSVATSSGTFVDVTGGTITTSGTITADLSATGTADATTFLRGDNTWVTPSGTGNMTSWIATGGNAGGAQTIEDGETLFFVGGNGIVTTGMDTRIIDFAIDASIPQDIELTEDGGTVSGETTVVILNNATNNTLGLIAGDNVTLTGSSAGTVKIESSGGVYSWTVADEHGNDQEVGDGGIVTIFGDDFIDCTLTTGGSDPYWSLSLDATGTASATTFLRGDNTWGEPVGAFDFDVKGDSGGPTTVGSANIIGVAGGYGPIITRLLTVVNGTTTQQFLIDHEESADPAIGGSYTNANITIDDFGHVTVAANGSTSGYEFDLDGDSGPTQTVEDGNTVTLAGGNGLDSVASATDTVTFAIDNTIAQAVEITEDGGTASGDGTVNIDNHSTANTVGLVAGDNVTLTGDDGGGTIKIESAAGSGMTSFDLGGDSGSTQTIEDGNTVTLAGGNGLDSVASATDTVTFAIDDSIAQAVAITAGGGTAAGDSTVNIDNHATANTVGLVAGGNVTLTGDDSAGTITIEAVDPTTCGTLPESDHPYAADTDESWEYECCCAADIDVTFNSDTEVEEGSDYIYIYEWGLPGTGLGSWTQIAGSPFTGTELASATKTLQGPKVKIKLVANGSVQEYGFKVAGIVDHQPGIMSFNLAGDSGSPQTLEDGGTITLRGGNGLDSVASATDTVTFEVDDSVVQGVEISEDGGTAAGDHQTYFENFWNPHYLGLVAGDNITLTGTNDDGTIKIESDTGYWTAHADSVPHSFPQVENQDVLDFRGATGITTVADGPGMEIEIYLEDTAVTPGSYSSADITVDAQGRLTYASVGTAKAPIDAQYVVLTADGDLTDERVLTAGTGITITDAGAGSTVTIAASGGGGGGNLTTKGDLEVYTTSQTRLGVGDDDEVLIADSTAAAGVKWGAAAAGGGGGGGTDLIVTEITSGTSLTVTDVAQDTIFQLNIPALDDTFMLTLPTAAAAGAGRRFHFMVTFDNEDWYEFQVNTAGSDLIYDTYFQNTDWEFDLPNMGGHTTAANYIPYSRYTLMSDGDNWTSDGENDGGYWYYND